MRKIILGIFLAAVFLVPLIVLPFTVDNYNPPKELFAQLAIVICVALWLMDGLRRGKFEILDTKFYWLLVVFCAISALSLFKSGSIYLGLRDLSQLIVYMGAFFICANVVRQKEAKKVALYAFVAGVIAAAYAIFQHFGIDFIKHPGERLSDWRFQLHSTFGNSDFVANYLILIFPAGFALYLAAVKFYKQLLLLLALIIMYIAVLVTFSVGAIAGLFAGLSFMLYVFINEKIKLKRLVCQEIVIPYLTRSIVLLIVILLFLMGFFFVKNKFNPSSLIEEAKSSPVWQAGVSERLVRYRGAYGMIKEHPALGVGIGNFNLRFPGYRGRFIASNQKYADSPNLSRSHSKNAHNEFLQIWAETGIFGVLLFVWIMFVVFRNGLFIYASLVDYKRKLFILGILSGITGFLVHSMISFPLHVTPNGFLFWVFIGMIFIQLPKESRSDIVPAISGVNRRILGLLIIASALVLIIWPARIYLGEVFFKNMTVLAGQGKADEALLQAKMAMALNPDSNAIIYVADYATLNSDYATAERALKKAIENNDEMSLHIALAEIYRRDGLPRDCISEYNRALRLNPFAIDIRLKLAKIYVDNAMYSEAEAECAFIAANGPVDDEMRKKLKRILNKVFDEKFVATYYDNVQSGE